MSTVSLKEESINPAENALRQLNDDSKRLEKKIAETEKEARSGHFRR